MGSRRVPSVEELFVRVLLPVRMADLRFIGWRRPQLGEHRGDCVRGGQAEVAARLHARGQDADLAVAAGGVRR